MNISRHIRFGIDLLKKQAKKGSLVSGALKIIPDMENRPAGNMCRNVWKRKKAGDKTT